MQHSDFLPASQPLLWDSQSCASWLAKVPMADPRQACSAFIELLDELEDAPPRHPAYLEILETLRPSIESSQEELSKRYLGRPLPLGHAERAAFERVTDLSHAFMSAYRRLGRAATRKSGAELSDRLPLLTQRAIRALGLQLYGTMRARCEPEPGLWQSLHQLYAEAESHGYASVEVEIGSPRHPQTTSCRDSYVRVLLFALANPYGMSAKTCTWTWRVAALLSRKVDLLPAAVTGGDHAIDLESSAGPAWLASEALGDATRYLHTRELGLSLKRRLHKLESGIQPVEIGLPRDISSQAAAQLCGDLRRAWVDGPRPRKYARRATAVPVEFASGFDVIHFALTGTAFRQTDDIWSYSRQQADRMHIFQHSGPHARAGSVVTAGLAAEIWEGMNESAAGFGLKRRADGSRLAQNQLVAVKPAGSKHFLFCEVRWMMADTDAALIAGMCAMPGLPHAAAVRDVRTSAVIQEKFQQAFVLSAAQDAPASLVLPLGWHKAERLIELKYENTVVRARLGELIGRGHDYDRVTFSMAD